MFQRREYCHVPLFVAIALTAPQGFAQHEGDIVIGRSDDNRVKWEFDTDEVIHMRSVEQIIFGWAGDEPGFEALEEDEPKESFFMLEPGARISFEVVEFDPAFQAWTPGLEKLLSQPGDRAELGDHELHTHVTWHIDSQHEAFDPEQTLWLMLARFVDTGETGYAPSDVLEIVFTNVECDEIRRLNARCKNGKLKAVIKAAPELDGAHMTVVRNGDDPRRCDIDGNRCRIKYGEQDGPQVITILECSELSAEADCG